MLYGEKIVVIVNVVYVTPNCGGTEAEPVVNMPKKCWSIFSVSVLVFAKQMQD